MQSGCAVFHIFSAHLFGQLLASSALHTFDFVLWGFSATSLQSQQEPNSVTQYMVKKVNTQGQSLDHWVGLMGKHSLLPFLG